VLFAFATVEVIGAIVKPIAAAAAIAPTNFFVLIKTPFY
jgi:hypothetical protein